MPTAANSPEQARISARQIKVGHYRGLSEGLSPVPTDLVLSTFIWRADILARSGNAGRSVRVDGTVDHERKYALAGLDGEHSHGRGL